MKRTFVYNPETKRMEERATLRSERYHTVMGDIKDFVSPISGEVISDRGAYRRHMREHELVPYEDGKVTAARVRREMAQREKQERLRSVIDSYEHVRNQERAKSRFG